MYQDSKGTRPSRRETRCNPSTATKVVARALPDTSAFPLPFYGVVLGARHALEPDHLAAVSTMAAHGSSRRDVLRISGAWGAGHASLIVLVGAGLALLRLDLPTHLGRHADILVGLVLIFLGIWTLIEVRRTGLHAHVHTHGAQPAHAHFHVHRHKFEHDEHPQPPHWLRRPSTAYLVGTLHGFAGSGAAVTLAVLAVRTQTSAAVYLLSFSIGSLLGMVAVGAFALWPIIGASSRIPRAQHVVQGLAGTTSLVIGCLLAMNRL